MSEAAAFLAHQSLALQTALYLGALVFLLCAGGIALTLLVGGLDRIGEAITADPDWQPRGEITKQEMLLLVGVLIYAQLLLSFEPAIRAFASVVGAPLVTSLMIAPIAGVFLYGGRNTRQRQVS